MVFTNLNLHYQIELFCFRKLSQNSRLVFTFPNSFGRLFDFFFSRMSSMTKLAKYLFFFTYWKPHFQIIQPLSCISRDCKVDKILKCSLDLIPSPSPSVKIQIVGGKVCLRCKGKTLLGIVNKLFVFKSLLTKPSNVLPLHLKQTFLPII